MGPRRRPSLAASFPHYRSMMATNALDRRGKNKNSGTIEDSGVACVRGFSMATTVHAGSVKKPLLKVCRLFA
jgi:hypothetical protein